LKGASRRSLYPTVRDIPIRQERIMFDLTGVWSWLASFFAYQDTVIWGN